MKSIFIVLCFLAVTVLWGGCKKNHSGSCTTCSCTSCPPGVGLIFFDTDDETSDNLVDGVSASYSDDNYLQPGPCLAGTYDYSYECGEGDCSYSGYYTLAYPAYGTSIQYTLVLYDDGASLQYYYLD